MPPLSDARFAYRNPLDLPRIRYADIESAAADGVYVEEPGTPRVFRRAAPVFHDDPDGAGLFPSLPEITVTYPPVFTASLRNVTLAGFRSVLSREGFLVNDLGHLSDQEARDFARGLARSNEIAQLTAVDGEGVFALDAGAHPTQRLEGSVVLLTSAEPGNYGSFLYRDLVKLVNLVEIPTSWRFLLHLPHKTYEQFLELAGVPLDRVIRHDIRTLYHIEHVIIPGLRSPYAYADPEVAALYKRVRERCDNGVRGRRIYISRRSASAVRPGGRMMVNEAELIERLEPLGFEIVEPQRLSAQEQVATFCSADLVVGPSGAGMFNAVFCRPGVKLIDIESEPHWMYPHSSLFASAKLQYGIFEGLAADRNWSVHHKPWKLNIEALLRRIDSFADYPPGSEEAPTPNSSQTPRALFWSRRDHDGDDYSIVLDRMHRFVRPTAYFEIGVADGASLALAKCSSIGIDPRFAIARPVLDGKPSCHFYQMTGDQFFRQYDPKDILKSPIDMAFLDGMHWFEVLLRDFINTEKNCKFNSVILLHDCLPTDEYVGRRDEDDRRLRGRSVHPDWWAGDVWKTLAILLKARPDLCFRLFNAPPTGLVAITRLSPSSTLLGDQYFELVDEYKNKTLTDFGDEFYANLEILDSRQYVQTSSLSSLFWL